MAGMLPGVESARRRRFHQTGVGFSDSIGSTRRSSFCLYSTNFASHNNNNNTFSQQRSSTTTNQNQKQIYKDEELGGAARVAKDRLDGRLRAQWKSDAKRIDVRNINNGTRGGGGDHLLQSTEEVIGLKNGRRLRWGKLLVLGWKLASNSNSSSPSSSGGQEEEEQEECAICLEGFKILMIGERVMQIACGHRFHSQCLLPWLDANAHCPCCRMITVPTIAIP